MLITLDFETEAIDTRPLYPPRPVGLAVKLDDSPGTYHSWGHPDDNARLVVEAATLHMVRKWLGESDNSFIFHNAPFDCSILEEVWGLTVPWERCHDTMLMAFLADPYAELGLKPLAERLLGDPPAERDAVKDWLVANGYANSHSKNWGAFIAQAPASLVGPYAIGDVDRTYKLFQYFSRTLEKRGLL